MYQQWNKKVIFSIFVSMWFHSFLNLFAMAEKESKKT